MLLGKLPSEHLLSAFDLTRQYSPLVKALKTGNYAAFMRYLEGPCKEWYIRNHLMFLFKSRAPIILLRQLMYKIYVFSGNNDTLTFSTVQFALALSMANTPNGWYDETKDKGHEMTENVLLHWSTKDLSREISTPEEEWLSYVTRAHFLPFLKSTTWIPKLCILWISGLRISDRKKINEYCGNAL